MFRDFQKFSEILIDFNLFVSDLFVTQPSLKKSLGGGSGKQGTAPGSCPAVRSAVPERMAGSTFSEARASSVRRDDRSELP